MFSKGSARPPRGLLALIIGITAVPLATLLWLGWRLLEQDRALEQQQVRQRVERGADLVVSALQRAVSVSEQQLAAVSGAVPDDAVTVTVQGGRVDVSPRARVAYLPVVSAQPEPPASVFVRATLSSSSRTTALPPSPSFAVSQRLPIRRSVPAPCSVSAEISRT